MKDRASISSPTARTSGPRKKSIITGQRREGRENAAASFPTCLIPYCSASLMLESLLVGLLYLVPCFSIKSLSSLPVSLRCFTSLSESTMNCPTSSQFAQHRRTKLFLKKGLKDLLLLTFSKLQEEVFHQNEYKVTKQIEDMQPRR